ncbi:hypothetical protein [Arvimicrobium flavum]|uniref:hypothetical protein n=1 Tax=Arvimicrobium flavum TaxID=3393320 RepID=UPI00237BDE43|nr:hypothetical protein [Mesorhizobium shangrilense]
MSLSNGRTMLAQEIAPGNGHLCRAAAGVMQRQSGKVDNFVDQSPVWPVFCLGLPRVTVFADRM